MSTIVADLFGNIDASFLAFMTGGAADVAAAVRPVFNTLVTVYVLLWGFAMWRGLIQEPLSDGVLRVVKIVLIGTFALNAAVYMPRIAGVIYRSPEQLAQTVAPAATAGGVGAALDNALDKGVEVGQKFSDAASIWSPVDGLALTLQALVVWIATAAIVGYAAALVLLAKIGLTVVLTLGPLFIALLLFEPTKQFFNGWMGQALNGLFQYVIAVVIASIAIAFFHDAAQTSATAIGGGAPSFVLTLQMLIVGVAVFASLMQSGAIASALAGGVQVGTMGLVGWTMRQGVGVATSPARGVQGLRNMNDRRLTRDYYRRSMGLPPTLTTRSLDWMRARIRGNNSVARK